MAVLPQSTVEAMARRRRAAYEASLPPGNATDPSEGIGAYWLEQAHADLQAALDEGGVVLGPGAAKVLWRLNRDLIDENHRLREAAQAVSILLDRDRAECEWRNPEWREAHDGLRRELER